MKVFYHADNDGKCAGFWVNKLAKRDNYPTEFIKMDYGIDFPFDKIQSEEIVYIVDYSIPPEEMDRLLEITQNVIWIDHHKSAIEKYANYDKEIRGLRYDGIAGCMLTYIYLALMVDHETGEVINGFDPKFAETAPLFTALVADYDVWTFQYGEQTSYFEKGMTIYPREPEDKIWFDLLTEESILKTDKSGYPILPRLNTICEQGMTIIQYRQSLMKDYCEKKGFEATLNGIKCYAVNMAMMGTDDFIIPNIDDYDLLVSFSFNGQAWNYSLRSTKIDCAELASSFGGGGHKAAAGFSTDKLVLEVLE